MSNIKATRHFEEIQNILKTFSENSGKLREFLEKFLAVFRRNSRNNTLVTENCRKLIPLFEDNIFRIYSPPSQMPFTFAPVSPSLKKVTIMKLIFSLCVNI